MTATQLAVAHQITRGVLASRVARLVSRFWSRVDENNIVGSWAQMVPAVAELIANGQYEAARKADPFLAQLLGDIDSEGSIAPEALAGIAGDGRPLPNLLMYPAWNTMNALSRGLSLAQSLATGRAFLDLLVRTQIADIGRQADLVGMISRPAVTSYIRVVEAPACSRCILLAGVEYGISEAFQRHPRCDCTMEPVTKFHTPRPASPEAIFDEMTTAQKIATFGEAGAEAIANGADMGQVVNARRGMGTATAYGRTVEATTEGTTKRGLAHSRVKKSPRLMPEEIMKLAENDRALQIRLLKKNGYIV